MKASLLTVFGLTAFAQWLVPLMAIRQHEQVLTEGSVIKLKCLAPDPYDPLRGRFLAVRPDWDSADAAKGETLIPDQPAYLVLTVGSDGYASAQRLTAKEPADGLYVRVKTRYHYRGKTPFTWPFDRFYLNEHLAPEADQWFAENIRSTKGITAEVRVLRGRAVLADLSVDGKPMREMLKERLR
jgi:uncharacterized membrane-anchored protein